MPEAVDRYLFRRPSCSRPAARRCCYPSTGQTVTIPLYRRLPLKVGIINNRSDFTSSEQIAIPGCLQLLEIFWNLVDAPGNVIISNEIFARRAIFSTLYIGKSSGKQDHYDFGLASMPSKCQLKPHKIGLETLQTSPTF